MNRFAVASAVAGVALLIAGQVLMSQVGLHLGQIFRDLLFDPITTSLLILVLALAACGVLIGLTRRDKGERSATLSGLAWMSIALAVLGVAYQGMIQLSAFDRIGYVPSFDIWSPSLVEAMLVLAVGLLASASIAAFNGRRT